VLPHLMVSNIMTISNTVQARQCIPPRESQNSKHYRVMNINEFIEKFEFNEFIN
jgi:hypothetical protein